LDNSNKLFIFQLQRKNPEYDQFLTDLDIFQNLFHRIMNKRTISLCYDEAK